MAHKQNELNPAKKQDTNQKYWLFALRIAGDFGATIAVPVVLLAYTGKRLDTIWNTGPWLLIVGFVVAAAISALMIYRKAKRYGKEFQNL